MSRALLVTNRRARRGTPALVGDAVAAFRRAGWAVDAVEAPDLGALASLVAAAAVDDGLDAIVALGGDGTVTEVIGPLVGSHVPVGIVPAGTGNLLAGNLGIPRGVGAAVRCIAAGRTRRIDLGRADLPEETRHFAIAMGVGFDARVMAATHPSRKQRFGKLAYFATAAGLAPFVEAVPHVVEIDGEPRSLDATEVIVANLGELVPGLIRPRFPVVPDDGLLDVIVVAAHGPLRGLLGAWEALIQVAPGEHPRGRVFRMRARSISIDGAPPQPVELDGDPRGTTPVRVSVLPRAISILVPA